MNQYGGFWRRVAAYFIDAILLAIAFGLMGALLGIGTTTSQFGNMTASYSYNADDAKSAIIDLLVGIIYFAGMEGSSMQATLGKKALNMVVTDLNGNRISYLRAVGRYLAKFLSAAILCIGFIMVGLTARKQGLHDMLAGTLVWKGHPVTTDPAVFA